MRSASTVRGLTLSDLVTDGRAPDAAIAKWLRADTRTQSSSARWARWAPRLFHFSFCFCIAFSEFPRTCFDRAIVQFSAVPLC